MKLRRGSRSNPKSESFDDLSAQVPTNLPPSQSHEPIKPLHWREMLPQSSRGGYHQGQRFRGQKAPYSPKSPTGYIPRRNRTGYFGRMGHRQGIYHLLQSCHRHLHNYREAIDVLKARDMKKTAEEKMTEITFTSSTKRSRVRLIIDLRGPLSHGFSCAAVAY